MGERKKQNHSDFANDLHPEVNISGWCYLARIISLPSNYRNLQPGDFGYFQAFVRYNTDQNNDTAVVEIVLDKDEQKRAALIGGALAGTVAVLILIGCALYVFRLRVRLLWRRSRFVSYESGETFIAEFYLENSVNDLKIDRQYCCYCYWKEFINWKETLTKQEVRCQK